MKKFLVLMLALTVGITVIACGLDETTTPEATTTTTESTGTTSSTASTTTTTTEFVTSATSAVTTASTIDYESNVNLNVAINYNGDQFITFTQTTAYTSTIDGITYELGDLLPAWAAIGEKLNITFTDAALASEKTTDAQWQRLRLGFGTVDLVNGTGANIASEAVQNGTFVDLGQYLTDMPHLSAFLDANPSVRISMTAADGGLYFTPYFDGLNEIEQMFLMRIDWVEDLLDLASPTFDTTAAYVPNAYTRQQMPDSLQTIIKVANSDGTTRNVVKSYTVNILDQIKALVNPTGATIANCFRNYIQATYGSQGYTKLSNVFCGTDAAYDTDELIALMYVVKSNPAFLTRQNPGGAKSSVYVYVPRQGTAQRINNFERGMEMFGLRGVFSKCEYLYFDQQGVIQDIRHDQKFVDGIGDLQTMSVDGLIPANMTGTANWVASYVQTGQAFMLYDYNATQTTNAVINGGLAVDSDFKFQAVLPPVVDWLGDGNYFHFTESVRSVKAEAWGVVKDATRSETELYRILKLVDEMYDYSAADSVGTMHLYGPEGWTDGTLQYAGGTIYKMSAKALAEMSNSTLCPKAGGAMINYLRFYVGSTTPIGHVRSMGLEYQTLSNQGKLGIQRINTAVNAGVMVLASNVDPDNPMGLNPSNPWFSLSPTTYPLTSQELADISASCSFRTSTNQASMTTLVPYGFTGTNGALTEAEYWALWTYNSLDVYNEIYIKAYRDAYSRVLQMLGE